MAHTPPSLTDESTFTLEEVQTDKYARKMKRHKKTVIADFC